MTRLARRLVPLEGDRLACAVQLFLLAAALSAANVMLGALATATFLVERGPDQLPLFYLLLAVTSVPLAAALGTVIDRWSRIRIFQGLMLFFMAAVIVVWLLVPLGLPAVPFAVYLTSHALDIAGALVFWVLASEYLTTRDLKHSTVALAMGLALGGALGGGAITLLSGVTVAANLLLLLPPLFLLMVGQAAWLGHSLEPIAEGSAAAGQPGEQAGLVESLTKLPTLMRRYRLVLLMALSVLLMTVLYCLQEYLVFTVYAAAFPDPEDLRRFLAMVYAGLQLAEFVLLYAFTRPLIARTGPVFRSAVFPVTTLMGLGWLGFTLQLPAAVLCHCNTDSVFNAVYAPVRTLNFTALPVRILGRVRTVADGIIYPAAMALGGTLLLLLQSYLTLNGIILVTVIAGFAFLAVEIAVGRSFLPTLIGSLRTGAVPVADVAESLRSLPASFSAEVRHLLGSADGDSRAVGLALALRLDPGAVLEPVCALAPGADPATRRAIAAVLVRAPAGATGPLVRGFLASDDPATQTLALQVALARKLPLDDRLLARLFRSTAPAVATLARLAAGDDRPHPTASPSDADPIGHVDPDTAEILIETLALGGGAPLAGLLAAIVRDGPHPLRARSLAALAELPEIADVATRLAETLSTDADPAVRAGALRLLAAAPPTPEHLARLVAALGDPDRRVRRAAAEALAAHGDQAVGLLCSTPEDADYDRWEATIWALGRMQSRSARAVLRALLAPTLEHATANEALMGRLPGARDPLLWEPLDVALADSNLRLVERVLEVLAALRQDRVAAQLRRALAAADLRTRANAVEALASLPDRGLIAAALPLVEAIALGRHTSHGLQYGHDGDKADSVALDHAGRSWDPWVRRGAAAVRAARAGGSGRLAPDHAGEPDMELLLFLKRTALLGSLPLDTLLALSRVLVAESYVAGETVVSDGSPGHCLYLVRSGTVDVLKDGRLLTRIGPGAFFGEVALVDDAPRSASVVAAADCTLLRLDRVPFQALTEDYPAMLRELCKLLAANLREANRKLTLGTGHVSPQG